MSRCKNFPLPDHLMKYWPEFKTQGVKSFLVLGQLCYYTLAFIKLIDERGQSKVLDETFDSNTRKSLRSKLEIIQSKCVKKAKESFEKYFQFKLPNVVTGIVFENLFKGGEDWKGAEEISKFEEVSEEDLEKLRNTFAELTYIYDYFRTTGYYSSFYCSCDRPAFLTRDPGSNSQIRSSLKKMNEAIEKIDTERF